MRQVPVFPLPDVWLLPSVMLPLHVFEPRYRQMIEDSLDGPGRIVLGTLVPGHELAQGPPPIHPLAGLGEIGRHERLADGRFDILLVGLERVWVREVPSDRLYRKVEIKSALEIPVAPARAAALRTRLVVALQERMPELPTIPAEFSLSNLADMLLLRLALPHAQWNAHFSELDVERRALALLEEHDTAPPGE